MAGAAPETAAAGGQSDGELDPWNWRVWLIDNPRRRAVRPARTRLAALIDASKQLHVDIDKLDAEVVRDA